MKRYEPDFDGLMKTRSFGDYVKFTEAQAIVKRARDAFCAIVDQEFMAAHSEETRMKDMADIARAALAALDAFGEGEK